MTSVPYSDAFFGETAAEFAQKITPAGARWEYCFNRASFVYDSPRFGKSLCLNERTFPVCARIIGCNPGAVRFRLGKIKQLGITAALEWDANQRTGTILKPWFWVGPMQAWQAGHVYFARLVDYPHIVKIGFSRRVRARLDDIESKVKSKIELRKGELRVGTMADEHWWHKNWERFNISGEWFFDPHMSERTLPAFLVKQEEAA